MGNTKTQQLQQEKQPTSSQLTIVTHPTFRHTPDLTERFVAQILSKCIEKPPDGDRPYFGWKGVGFQFGICFNSVPSHVNFLTVMSLLMVNSWVAPSNASSMLLTGDTSQEIVNTETQQGVSKKASRNSHTEESRHRSESDSCCSTDGDKPFVFTAGDDDSSTDQKLGEFFGRHRWLNMSCKISEPITAIQLSEAKLHSCFAIVDKPTN